MAPIIAGTLQTDARSGGIKKSSGVIVLPIVGESEYIRSLAQKSNVGGHHTGETTVFWLSRNLAS
jgi:hypothetical protein